MEDKFKKSATHSQQLVKNQYDLDTAIKVNEDNIKEVYFPYNLNQMNSQLIAMPDVLPQGGKLFANATTHNDCQTIAAQQFTNNHKINFNKALHFQSQKHQFYLA